MKHSYDHKSIESKWQKKWADENIYTQSESPDKPKCYVLDMFPYPSGKGIHMGHPKGYTATDVYSRFKHMNGFNMLHPMGWDAFGLPAENYAIKNKVNPKISTTEKVQRFKQQLSLIGFSYDWNREIDTTDPKYYKWTQWAFLQMYKKGLAFESHEPINWCPECKTGLANEDLESDGTCERCGSIVEQKPMRQWVLKITDYADRLLEDLEQLDEWPQSVKESQKNWIGRSEGAELTFKIKDTKGELKVFTTRPDTLYGATYCVVAPEHPLIHELESMIKNIDQVKNYIEQSKKKTTIERTAEGKEKSGVELQGITAINPVNNKEIPVWVGDYVLGNYGTGAVMAVPAHDERDFDFARKYNLDIIEVIKRGDISEKAYTDDGELVNSEDFNGKKNTEIFDEIVAKAGGEKTVNYRLQDWVFSRQRYWGEPIPLIHCDKCGVVPVPEDQLPVVLPDVESYEPTGTGESPLAAIDEWVNVDCPECGCLGKRETNTMPQWAGSCWYYLRYMDPKNENALVDPEKEKYWAPVDLYVGGAEHATRHLIYARFWHKFLHDIGVVSTTEPFKKLINVGLVMAEDGRKMSKRWGNVINPDEMIERFGADSMRVYLSFMGPFENAIAWNTDGMVGSRRFIERVLKAVERIDKKADLSPELERIMHQTIKKVGDDIQAFSMNTAVSQMMIFLNEIEKNEKIPQIVIENLIKILSPFAPHITDEIAENLGIQGSLFNAKWPQYDESKLVGDTVKVAIQVNGKVRDTIEIDPEIEEGKLWKSVFEMESISKWTAGKEIKKKIYIKGKIINIVVS